MVNTDPSKPQEKLMRALMKKLQRMEELIYRYGAEHSGTVEKRKKNVSPIPTNPGDTRWKSRTGYQL